MRVLNARTELYSATFYAFSCYIDVEPSVLHSKFDVSLLNESIISNKCAHYCFVTTDLLHLAATNMQPTKLNVLVIYPLVRMSTERPSDPLVIFAEEMINVQND